METLTKNDLDGEADYFGEASRRVFIKGMGFVGVSLLLTTLGGCYQLTHYINSLPIRRRLRTGSVAVDADIADYRNAVQLMKALPSSDLRNWLAEANIHGNTGFNMCEHGTDHFFDWHRAYLFHFEKICQKLLGKPKFGLPYWNWNQDPDIHDDYFDSSSPLFMSSRFKGSMNTQTGIHSGVSTSTLDTIFSDTNFLTFQAQLEGTPHNSVHSHIGGSFGTFNKPSSAQDPLFWNHHCMIDYCWYKWNVELGQQNTNDPNWLNHVNGQFVDGDGQPATTVAASTILMPVLTYRYETSAIGSSPARMSLPRDVERLQARLKAGADIRFVVKQRIRLAERASASVRQPLLLRVPLAARDFTAVMEDRNAPERVFVTVETVDVAQPGELFVRIFLNLPAANAGTPDTDPHFAGSFAFFGNPAAEHARHAGRPGRRPLFMVDVTRTLQRLRQSGAMAADAPLTVQLVPTPYEASEGVAAVPAPDFRLVLSGIDIMTTPVILASPPEE